MTYYVMISLAFLFWCPDTFKNIMLVRSFLQIDLKNKDVIFLENITTIYKITCQLSRHIIILWHETGILFVERV
jgi:hypothetical protein